MEPFAINEDINSYSTKVLTIGCHCNPPKGGVACVLHTYMTQVYKPFKFVANSGEGNKLAKFWQMISAYAKCEWREIFDKDIQIVHIHTSSYNSFKRSVLYINQAKRHGKKIVCHIHGGAFREFRDECPEFVDKYLKKCDAIVVLSETWRKYFADELGMQNVYVVNNLIEEPQLIRVEKGTKFHILFLGLIAESKGIFDLLEVVKENKKDWNDRIVLHVGGNGEVDKFKQLVSDWQLQDMVVYEGWVSGNKKINLLNLADAYILPSYTEGVPISILESLSYGLPVLSTPVGGIPEVIRSGENGILFQPGDKVAMATAINQLLNDASLCKRMSMKGIQDSNVYLPESIENQLVATYNSILTNR